MKQVETTIKNLINNKIALEYVMDYAKRHNISIPMPKYVDSLSERFLGVTVRLIRTYKDFDSEKGKIVKILSEGFYGIDFGVHEFGFHDLDGALPNPTGYYLSFPSKNKFEIIDSE